MRRWIDSEIKSNEIKHFFMIITNLVSAENLDLSQPWESNDSYIFLSQLDSVIAENIENLPNIAGILISKNGKIIATFEIAWLTGWKYHESQQKPLKRGSGKTSMLESVKKFEE